MSTTRTIRLTAAQWRAVETSLLSRALCFQADSKERRTTLAAHDKVCAAKTSAPAIRKRVAA